LLRWGKQALFHLEALDEVPALLLGRLEVVFLRMSEDKVEREKSRLDVRQFVFAAIPQVTLADGGINFPGTKLKDQASARVSAGIKFLKENNRG